MITAPILLIGYSIWALLLSEPDERLLLTPIFLSAAIIFAMIERFWRRDRHLPIVDVGVLCAFITLVYVAMPAISYIKSGFVWTDLSDSRLVLMKATPEDVAEVLWIVTAYLAALCLSYGLLRGPGMPEPKIVIDVKPAHGWALFAILLFAIIYQFSVEKFFGIDLNSSNEALQDNYGIQQLPLFLAQITHNALGIGRIAKLGLIAFAISRKSWLVALVLTGWLLLEGYSTLSTLGSRTYFAMLIMVVVLSYHRIVRPIGAVPAVIVAVVTIAVLMGYGYLRDVGQRVTTLNDIWSAATEFQVLLANGIHSSWAYDRGIISDVPWAIKLSDLIMLIPQQLLPFQKLDPADWYVDQIGAAGEGTGLMFGMIAQAKLGYGIAEIIVRGALLGAVLAFIHRKCVKNAASLTAFIVYLWLCASIYYTYRATTFYIAVYAVYRVIPFVLLFWCFSWVFGPRRSKFAVMLQEA